MSGLNRLRRILGRADVFITAMALLLYLMGVSWSFAALYKPIDGITNVILKLLTGDHSIIFI
jgi:hypothetical protein